MTVAVGYLAGKSGRSPLYLAAEAAKTLKTSLTVVTVVPRPWVVPSLGRIDGEYAQYADQLAANSAKEAQGASTRSRLGLRSTTTRSLTDRRPAGCWKRQANSNPRC